MADRRRYNGVGLGVALSESSGGGPAGYVGTKAASLDGVDERLSSASTITISNAGAGFSVSFWFTRNDASGDERPIFIGDSTYSAYVVRQGSGRFGLGYIHAAGGFFAYESGTTAITPGAWVHVVASFDMSGANHRNRLWVNGALVSTNSGSYGTAGALTATAYVGATNTGAVRLNGKICDVAVWNTAMTNANVTAMYNGGLRGDPEALTGLTAAQLWPFQVGDDMTATTGHVSNLKTANTLTPINTEAGDLADGPP